MLRCRMIRHEMPVYIRTLGLLGESEGAGMVVRPYSLTIGSCQWNFTASTRIIITVAAQPSWETIGGKASRHPAV